MLRVLHGHSGYGAFEGHRKEDVTSKVSDSPFTNLTQRSDSVEKPMLIDDFLVVEMLIKRRITTHTSWSGGIRMLPCISTSRNTIVLG